MRAHVLQHVDFEGPGTIVPWLLAAQYEVSVTRFDLGEALPEVSSVDFLVVMGGPMSVNDDALHPWLSAELDFVRCSLHNGTPILGVCLGAQLLAKAVGAAVYPNAEPEIGWFPIEPVDAGCGGDIFRFPSTVDVFHWHGETFDLPAGAVHLARSHACAHQAFQLGTSAIGLQFHIETTPQLVDGLVAHGRHELLPRRWVQNESRIRAAGADRYEALGRLLDEVLGYLHAARPRSVVA